MRSFFNVDSTVITHWLVEVRKNYFIPPEYKLHVPLLGVRPYEAIPCDFSLSTDALEAGLRLSLHPVIEACLEQWRISHSHMASNSWRYLVAFLCECHVSGIRATKELFIACFRLIGDAGVSTVEKDPSSDMEARLRKRLRKASVGQELAAATELRAKELEAEIERMRIELESLKSQRMKFEQEVGLLRFSLDGLGMTELIWRGMFFC
ncbi:hypothetical protein B296_00022858 [Ensete ventricosum]|uniref:Transposase (putative) gypsy type domain-containing protein n=1 Tax=Ensete ventricosum TaxID=4639 RepID=A0A426ZA62_ENSVE|nr:hypothetical protein B296_00022858 [Ensete ventricosum]